MVQDFVDVAEIDYVKDLVLEWTIPIGLFIGFSTMGIKFATEYFTQTMQIVNGAGKAESALNGSEVARVGLLLMILLNFAALENGFEQAMGGLNNVTARGSETNNALIQERLDYNRETLINAYKDDVRLLTKAKKGASAAELKGIEKEIEQLGEDYQAEYEQSTAEIQMSLTEEEYQKGLERRSSWSLTNMFDLKRVLSDGMFGLSYLFAGIAKLIIGGFTLMTFKMALAFGPLVLGFGVVFRNKPMEYIGMLINLGLVFTTINILDMMLGGFMRAQWVKEDFDMSHAIAVNIIQIAAYFKAFSMTKWFVGTTGLNGYAQVGLGKVGALIGAGAIALGMAAGAGSKKGAAGVSQGVQGVARQTGEATRQRPD